MRIIQKSFRLYVDPARLDDTVTFYEQLQEVNCERRLRFEQAGIDVAVVGNFIILAGNYAALSPMRDVQATFTVDSLDEIVAWLSRQGGALLAGPKPSGGGRNATLRHPDGLVVEYFESGTTMAAARSLDEPLRRSSGV